MKYFFEYLSKNTKFVVHKQKTMPSTKEKRDVRDEILSHLKEIERPMSWLSKKSEVAYSTLYASLIQRTCKISDDNLVKINSILGTRFKN